MAAAPSEPESAKNHFRDEYQNGDPEHERAQRRMTFVHHRTRRDLRDAELFYSGDDQNPTPPPTPRTPPTPPSRSCLKNANGDRKPVVPRKVTFNDVVAVRAIMPEPRIPGQPQRRARGTLQKVPGARKKREDLDMRFFEEEWLDDSIFSCQYRLDPLGATDFQHMSSDPADYDPDSEEDGDEASDGESDSDGEEGPQEDQGASGKDDLADWWDNWGEDESDWVSNESGRRARRRAR